MKATSLSVHSFATAGAILFGADCFLHAFLGWMDLKVLWYNPFTLSIIMTMFPGAGPSGEGTLLAAAWGAFTGALALGMFAWLHNWAQKKFR